MIDVMLLGAARVRRRSGADVALSPAVTHLLAYLLVRRNGARETLVTDFWEDLPPDTARRRLNTAVWRLRRALGTPEPGDPAYVTVTASGAIALAGTWADVTAFEERVTPVLGHPPEAATDAEIAALREAVALYRGDLLEGSYESWVIAERERLAGLLLTALARLVVHFRDREPDLALRYAGQVLDRDALREDVHRTVMRLYAATGRRTQALQQYERCRALLAEELSVEPMPETTALAAAISAGRPFAAPPVPLDRAELLARLEQAQQTVQELDVALKQAIEALTRR